MWFSELRIFKQGLINAMEHEDYHGTKCKTKVYYIKKNVNVCAGWCMCMCERESACVLQHIIQLKEILRKCLYICIYILY